MESPQTTTLSPSDEGVVSYTKLSSFLNCRRQYWFRYVEKLVPLRKPEAMAEGTLVHSLLERVPVMTLDEAVVDVAKFGPIIEPAMMVRAKAAVRAVITNPGWRKVGIAKSEVEFEVPVFHGNKAVFIRGKIDAVGTYNTVPMAFEYKRIGSMSTRTLENIRVNNQSLFYRAALKHIGLDVAGVVYVFVQVPKAQPKKAMPSDEIRYRKDGAPYTGQQLVDETLDEFTVRVDTWYWDHPDAVTFYVDQRSDAAMVRFGEWLHDVMADLGSCCREKRFYQNSEACRHRGCSYSQLCVEDSPDVRVEQFSIGKNVVMAPDITDAEVSD